MFRSALSLLFLSLFAASCGSGSEEDKAPPTGVALWLTKITELDRIGGAPPTKLPGSTEIPLRDWVPRQSWHHVALVRDGTNLAVYLDGRLEPEISGGTAPPPATDQVFIGGRSDGQYNFEGRIDEVAIYTRTLSAEEIHAHYQAATGR